MRDHESLRARPTGTHAVGQGRSCATGLHRDEGGSATPPSAEFVVVDLIAQHDKQPHEQLPSNGHFGLGASTAMNEREVSAPEVSIHAGRMSRGLTESEAEQRAALLSDVTEMVFIGRGIEGRGQADIADHVLAIVEPGHGAQHDDGGEGGQGPDTGMK